MLLGNYRLLMTHYSLGVAVNKSLHWLRNAVHEIVAKRPPQFRNSARTRPSSPDPKPGPIPEPRPQPTDPKPVLSPHLKPDPSLVTLLQPYGPDPSPNPSPDPDPNPQLSDPIPNQALTRLLQPSLSGYACVSVLVTASER